MRALIYYRRRGEREYRELGVQEITEFPASGAGVTLDVDGVPTRARVIGRRGA